MQRPRHHPTTPHSCWATSLITAEAGDHLLRCTYWMAGGPEGHTSNLPSWPPTAPSHTRAMAESECSPHPQGPPDLHSSYAKKADLGWGFPACLWFIPSERKSHSWQPAWAPRALWKSWSWGTWLGKVADCLLLYQNLFLSPPDFSWPKVVQITSFSYPFLHRHRRLYLPQNKCMRTARSQQEAAQTRGVSVSLKLLPQLSPQRVALSRQWTQLMVVQQGRTCAHFPAHLWDSFSRHCSSFPTGSSAENKHLYPQDKLHSTTQLSLKDGHLLDCKFHFSAINCKKVQSLFLKLIVIALNSTQGQLL